MISKQLEEIEQNPSKQFVASLRSYGLILKAVSSANEYLSTF